MYRCYFLPVGQISAQLAACSLRVVVRSLIADEALFAEQLCAVLLDALTPIAHPLAVAPAVGAKRWRRQRLHPQRCSLP